MDEREKREKEDGSRTPLELLREEVREAAAMTTNLRAPVHYSPERLTASVELKNCKNRR